MTKIARLNQAEGQLHIQICDEAIPQPGKHEVLVRIHSAGLNRAELLFMNGQYLVEPQLPSRIGVEGAGVIEALGENVSIFSIGDEVCITPYMDFEKYGVIGEHAIVPQSALVEKPQNLSWEEASSIWMAYPTAYGGLVYSGGLIEGAQQTVVISAASSSVGLPAIQIAKAHGAKVIATSRSLKKVEILKEQGADFVVATHSENWPEIVMDITGGKGFDIAFDPITGAFTSQLAEVAANGATIVSYGVLSMEETPLPLFPMMVRGLNFTGFHVVYHLLKNPERFAQAKKHILNGLIGGTYSSKISEVFPLDEVIEAYTYMESGVQEGKIILKMI